MGPYFTGMDNCFRSKEGKTGSRPKLLSLLSRFRRGSFEGLESVNFAQ